MKIGFIGIGKLGLPCAEAMASKGHNVVGYDVVARKSNVIDIAATIKDCVQDRDIVFIAVPTPHHSDTTAEHQQPVYRQKILIIA